MSTADFAAKNPAITAGVVLGGAFLLYVMSKGGVKGAAAGIGGAAVDAVFGVASGVTHAVIDPMAQAANNSPTVQTFGQGVVNLVDALQSIWTPAPSTVPDYTIPPNFGVTGTGW